MRFWKAKRSKELIILKISVKYKIVRDGKANISVFVISASDWNFFIPYLNNAIYLILFLFFLCVCVWNVSLDGKLARI